jgi:hypothetical protein
MKKWTFCFVLLMTFLPAAISQVNRKDVNSVLSEFLENSADARYMEWGGNENDSLRLDPYDYDEMVRSYNKFFRVTKPEKCFFAKSYIIDSLQVLSDHAFGYVTLDIVSYGYVLNRLPIMMMKLHKVYLLINKSQYWYVLSETGDWFISLNAYIKWAENYLPDMTLTKESQYKSNVVKNLKDFKELIKTP